MKKLIFISVLVFSFNGWTNDEYNQCLEMAEEAKSYVLQPAKWNEIESAINREESLIPERARNKARSMPFSGGGAQASLVREKRARQIEAEMQKEIQAKRNQLEKDKQADLEKVAKSKREATKLYVDIMKLCNDLK